MNVKNRLDDFSSHSVHYIVLAARSTEDLRHFTDDSQSATNSLQAIDACNSLGDAVKTKSGNAYLVMDTRRFSQFTIDNFEIDTKIAGFNVNGSTSPNAVGLEMNFTVLDSTGISFMNFLQYLMEQRLQVSYDGMMLLVKVLFVGHTPSGGTKVVQSIAIPAIFKNIELDLNEVKGVYTCQCIPLLGMQSNSNYNIKWTSVGTASSYFTGPGANTLGAVVQAFEDRLNQLSLDLYAKSNGIITTPGQSQKTIPQFGRPVQYMITIPDTWKSFKFSGPTQGGATEINFQELLKKEEQSRANTIKAAKEASAADKKTAEAKESFVSVDPNLTITEILDTILAQTIEVQQLANFTGSKNKTDTIKFYKHLITVTSSDENFTVHVDVVEFVVPNVLLAEQKKEAITEDDQFYTVIPATSTSAEKKVPKNYLEFDYIFSGKNIDVLSLNLKIENLNLLLMQGTKIGQNSLQDRTVDGQKQDDGKQVDDYSTMPGRGAKDPLTLRMLTAEQRTNFSNIAANAKLEGNQAPQAVAQQYTKNLSDFYNAGTQAKMTIRGNPDFLAGIVLHGIPSHKNAVSSTASGVSKANDNVKKQWRDELSEKLGQKGLTKNGDAFEVKVMTGPSFVTTPVFVKVNVFTQDVDFLSLDPSQGQKNFAKQLFTNNYYFLTGVKSKIENSRFTQECDMLHFSIYGHKSTSAQGQTKSTVENKK